VKNEKRRKGKGKKEKRRKEEKEKEKKKKRQTLIVRDWRAEKYEIKIKSKRRIHMLSFPIVFDDNMIIPITLLIIPFALFKIVKFFLGRERPNRGITNIKRDVFISD
jgi:hypothetical protein